MTGLNSGVVLLIFDFVGVDLYTKLKYFTNFQFKFKFFIKNSAFHLRNVVFAYDFNDLSVVAYGKLDSSNGSKYAFEMYFVSGS